MVKISRAERGDRRNIIIWTEGQVNEEGDYKTRTINK
jgi:hypothetical protein